MVFSSARNSLIFSIFPSFPRSLGVRWRQKILVFWGGGDFLAFFQQKQGKEGQGLFLSFQGGSGTEPEPETGTVGTVSPGTRTVRTIFQEPKPELSVPVYLP